METTVEITSHFLKALWDPSFVISVVGSVSILVRLLIKSTDFMAVTEMRPRCTSEKFERNLSNLSLILI